MTTTDDQNTHAHLDRRKMLTITGLGLVGGALASGMAQSGAAAAEPGSRLTSVRPRRVGWGPLQPAGPHLALPEGFSYRVLGAAGTRMSDGRRVPGAHDGMACFAAGRGRVRLLRNHELETGMAGVPLVALSPTRPYDPAAPGGVTSTLYDINRRRVVESHLALNGTLSNCNGGKTPWGSWLSCEESTEGPDAGLDKPHGYVFEVPADSRGIVEPVPLRAMGRFTHEAAIVDPRTGVIYMTEDNGEPGDGFYRFIPNRRFGPGRRGDLTAGGQLQMLAVIGQPTLDTASDQRIGVEYQTRWVDIDRPDPSDAEDDPAAVYRQGRNRGGARFIGLEGACWARGGIVFTASEGGDEEQGQIWKYTPKTSRGGLLKLVYESRSDAVLNQPDGLAGGPAGSILMCEDGDGEDVDGGTNFLRVLTRSGQVVDLAEVIAPLDLHAYDPEDFPSPGPIGTSELAGACFSPDRRHLFVNLQYPGATLVISGPFARGL